MSLLREERLKKVSSIAKDDKVMQIYSNERYDQYVLMHSGRIFKARARGNSGAYDAWHEIDLIAEIKSDLKLQ